MVKTASEFFDQVSNFFGTKKVVDTVKTASDNKDSASISNDDLTRTLRKMAEEEDKKSEETNSEDKPSKDAPPSESGKTEQPKQEDPKEPPSDTPTEEEKKEEKKEDGEKKASLDIAYNNYINKVEKWASDISACDGRMVKTASQDTDKQYYQGNITKMAQDIFAMKLIDRLAKMDGR